MKSQEVQLSFDYAALDTETRAYVLERTERIHNLARMTASSIVQIGQYLTQVKERLGHGKFLEWIEREFAWGEHMARKFIQVHERFKTRNFHDLDIDVSALYLIAAPSTPEPVRNEVVRRATNGEPVTHSGVRALVQEFADTGEMPEVEVTLTELVQERKRQTAPKKTRPSPEEEQRNAELEKLRAEAKKNGERVSKVFNVLKAIETLNGTELTAKEIAAEIQRWDTPDKNWRGQSELARRKLAAICTELKQ